MRKVFALVVTMALLVVLIEPNAIAKKHSRSGRATVQAGRGARGKARGRVQAGRGRHGRTAYVAARGTRGRRAARSRSRRYYAAQPVDSTVTSRPAPGISSERVTEIQNALIKAGYLESPPSGQYDEPTIGAMRQFQSKSGLPGNGMPSALALKKRGVSKRTNDGYAVPVTSVSQNEKKHP
jgi:hypothetical protein